MLVEVVVEEEEGDCKTPLVNIGMRLALLNGLTLEVCISCDRSFYPWNYT